MEILLATYNVMNLFDSSNSEAAKPRREVQSLAYTIERMQPDVLALQEVGSEVALSELNDRFVDPFPHIGFMPGNSDRSIGLAFMSRIAFDMTSHASRVLTDEQGEELLEYRTRADNRAQTLSPLLFQRDFLLAQFPLEAGGSLALFNAHFKSRKKCSWHLNATDDIRLAEVRMASRIVQEFREQHPQMPIVVAGDFNEVCDHASVLPLAKGSDLSDPVHDELISKSRLTTTYWSKQRERIDYVLLCETARRAYIPGSAAIVDHAGARKASDHLPVMLRLRLAVC